MKSILVTGAAGFIGSTLSKILLQQGYHVTGIDSFDPFYPREIKVENIKPLLESKQFELLELDIRNSLEPLSNKKFDAVIHLAAKAGVLSSISDTAGYLKTNVLGTNNLLEYMKKTGCRNMVFGSSSSVYGANASGVFSEDSSTDFPLSPYAASKKACELLLHNYHHLFGFSVACLRFFSVYGPAQRPDLAFNKFSKLMAANQAITLYGDGTSSRDYTYVSDIVEGILLSLAFIDKPEPVYECINIGNGKPITLIDMVKKLYAIMGKPENLQFIDQQAGDMPHTCANISKAQIMLGYSPKVSFDDGLELFMGWIEGQRKSSLPSLTT